jgi:hypothetical protein
MLPVLDPAPGTVWVNREGHRGLPVHILEQDHLRSVILIERRRVVLVSQAERDLVRAEVGVEDLGGGGL